jgi:PAS domain S-box-containing protein
MPSSLLKGWSKQFPIRLLQLWLPLVFLLGLVIVFLYRSQVNHILTIAKVNGQQWAEIAQHTINTEFNQVHSDVLYLSGHTALHHWLADKDLGTAQFSQDVGNFALRRGRYDQIRFIDLQGREQIRVDSRSDWQATPAKQLQSKEERYYVSNTLALKQGEIYISPFDLNIEYGEIEHPIKPIIRFGSPVFDEQGRKRGLVIVNYLGQSLLDQLTSIPANADNQLWLVNRKGDWLLGPDSALAWGFMYPQRAPGRFEHVFPEAWARLQEMPEHGQFSVGAGLFTYAQVTPLQDVAGASDADWILIDYLPGTVLAQRKASIKHQLVAVFIALLILLGVMSGVIAWAGERRRQNEHSLRASEARFRDLLDSAPDPIVIVDQAGCISLVNAQAGETFGYTSDELLGESIEILLPSRFHQAFITNRNWYVTETGTHPMGEGTELYGLRKDGSELPIEISLSPRQTDQGMLVTIIIRDISARKEAEEAQRQVQTRYQELVHNLPVGVCRNTSGENGRFLEVNPAMLDIFEATSIEQLLAYPLSEMYCDPGARLAFLEDVMRKGHANSEELSLKTLRGREFHAAITTAMKRDDNNNIYFDGIIEDITARKKNELRIQRLNASLHARSTELEVTNKELEAFSYSVSHDLRTPLRAMDGFSRTLLKDYGDQLDERGRDRLDRIRAAAQRMGALIDDLLKLSRVSRTELKREPVDLTQLASKVMARLQESEPDRALRFTVQSGLVAQGDVQLLQVVLENLLGNAWKFTGQCSEAVIEIGKEKKANENIYFVRDNGAGFDMAYADKLFSAFQRLHDARDFPGTGIGLATVQRVIHKHGGRVWSESAVNEGATFYFTVT